MYRDSGDSGALHSLIFQHLYANALYSMLIWVWTLHFLIEGSKKVDTLKLKLPGL